MEKGVCGRFTLRCIQGLFLLCILCVGITINVSAIDEFAGGQSPSFSIITPKTVTVSCPAPCECMISSDADTRWGNGNYVSCSNTPCREVVVNSELRVPMFCYRVNSTGSRQDPEQPQLKAVVTLTPVPADGVAEMRIVHPEPVQKGSYSLVPARLQNPPIPDDNNRDGVPNPSDTCTRAYSPDQSGLTLNGTDEACQDLATAIKNAEAGMEEVPDKKQETMPAFENFDQKVNQLINVLASAAAAMNSMTNSIIRNLA